jgi:hypothetical protein
MNQTYGTESETERIRGAEGDESLRINANRSEAAKRVSKRTGSECLPPDRKNRTEGIGAQNAVGGIIDQLIEDARKQLAKSRECIVWYQSEAREFEERLRKFEQLKELHELQQIQGDEESEATLE